MRKLLVKILIIHKFKSIPTPFTLDRVAMKLKEKYYFIIGIICFSLLFQSCLKEDLLVATSEFTFQETALQDGKKLTFTNLSQNGDTFKWTFENGLPSESNKFNPGDVIFSTPGTHKITLEVSNRDGSFNVFQKQVQVLASPNVNFTASVLESNTIPAAVKITNLSSNVSNYQWIFEGANPATFTGANPPNITYNSPGIKTIKLITEAGEKSINIEISPSLTVSFTYNVKPIDDDMTAPAKVYFTNTSESATTYQWSVNGETTFSTLPNPEFLFATAGTYNVTLTASNTKQTVTTTKSIIILPYSNISTQNNIELGIVAAQNSVGASYSTINKTKYKSSEITTSNGADIDLVFYGINASFSFCSFVSPNKANTFGLTSIPNAANTVFNNKQEENNTNIPVFTNQDFDQLTNAMLENSTIPVNTNLFNSSPLPRIIPFQTQDGRKGLIKLKSIVADGNNSKVIIDIKVQKH